MPGAVYICTPGLSMIPPETRGDLCRCRHARDEHWWGGGDCGYMFSTGSTCRCQYWRKPKRRTPRRRTDA